MKRVTEAGGDLLLGRCAANRVTISLLQKTVLAAAEFAVTNGVAGSGLGCKSLAQPRGWTAGASPP